MADPSTGNVVPGSRDPSPKAARAERPASSPAGARVAGALAYAPVLLASAVQVAMLLLVVQQAIALRNGAATEKLKAQAARADEAAGRLVEAEKALARATRAFEETGRNLDLLAARHAGDEIKATRGAGDDEKIAETLEIVKRLADPRLRPPWNFSLLSLPPAPDLGGTFPSLPAGLGPEEKEKSPDAQPGTAPPETAVPTPKPAATKPSPDSKPKAAGGHTEMIAPIALAALMLQAPASAARQAPVGPSRPGGSLPGKVARDASGRIVPVWVAVEGERFLATPNAGSPLASGSTPSRFLERFSFAEEFVAPTKVAYRLLVRPADPRLVGWVRTDRLVTLAGAEVDPATHVARKVIVVETPQSLRNAEAARDLAIRPLRAPRSDAAAAEGPSLVPPRLFFRYAEVGGFVLIGTSPTLDDAARAPEAAVLGWVSKDRTIPFDGRLAAEWDERSVSKRVLQGEIFQSKAEAFDFGRAEAGQETPDPMAREVRYDTGAALQFHPSDPRFPVLDYQDDDPDRPEVDPVTENHLLRLGWLGGFLDEAATTGVEGKREAADRERKTLLAKMREPLQIVFVIDDTESMQPYFAEVAAQIDAIMKEASRHKGRVVEVAVCYYNDAKYVGGKGHEVGVLEDATSPAAARTLADVGKHRAKAAPAGNDYRRTSSPACSRPSRRLASRRTPRPSG